LVEKSLHNSIKQWYFQQGDHLEEWIDGYLIDIVRGKRLIEIQTSNFSAIKEKLVNLVQRYPVRIVHPVSAFKWIVRLNTKREQISKRKSPKKGRIEDLFLELVYIPRMIEYSNFSIEVLMVRSEEYLIDDGRGSWRRRRWSIYDRQLVDVVGRETFQKPTDFLRFIPKNLPVKFTTKELAESLGIRINLAHKMTYTLRKSRLIQATGKRGRAILYSVGEKYEFNP
jgi:hypothetical protein